VDILTDKLKYLNKDKYKGERKMKKMKQALGLEIFPKTIYADIVSMPDPMVLGLTFHYYNFSDITLYMKMFIEGPSPWSSNNIALGSLASGNNAYYNWDNATSRTKPTSAVTESLTLTLRGYTDSGYSNLVYEFSRTLTVVFIKSDDGTWTTDYSDNFDDGSVQGWAVANENNNSDDYPHIQVATDYILSTPYSCKMTQEHRVGGTIGPYEIRARLYKSFNTSSRTTQYAILNIRNSEAHDNTSPNSTWGYLKYIKINNGEDTILIYLGRSYDGIEEDYAPRNKWMRIVVPIPANSSVEIRIIIDGNWRAGTSSNAHIYFYTWLDDFKIISK